MLNSSHAHTASFTDRVGWLFEELHFAAANGRPSILIAPYASEYIRREAESALANLLQFNAQALLPFQVDEEHFDLPLELSRHPEKHTSVFSIRGLSYGGGREGVNAFIALNMRRELLVDGAVRAVFWLDPSESVALSRHAPDFWAFRHRVIEFDLPSDLRRLPLPPDPNLPSHEPVFEPFIQKRTIRRLRNALRLNPSDPFSWAELGRVYLAQKRLELARWAFNKSLALAPFSPEALLGLGRVQRLLGHPLSALEALRNAVSLSPTSPDVFLALADLCLDLGLWSECAQACKSVIALSPGEPIAWFLLGKLCQLSARHADAIINYQHSIELDPTLLPAGLGMAGSLLKMGKSTEAEACLAALKPQVEAASVYSQALWSALSGETSQALDCLSLALGQGLVSPLRLEREPSFDLIRADARFQEFLVAKGTAG